MAIACTDPITMPPAQLIFSHWQLGDRYCSVLEDLQTISHQGANLQEIKMLDAELNEIEAQLKTSETFLRMAGLSDMEIYQ